MAGKFPVIMRTGWLPPPDSFWLFLKAPQKLLLRCFFMALEMNVRSAAADGLCGAIFWLWGQKCDSPEIKEL
jgi:hypothetical protein